MIIGVDAGALSIQDERLKVGVYQVTLNVLQELSLLDSKNEYRLFSFEPIDPAVLRTLGKNMKNVVVRPKIGWSTLQLPLHLRMHPVDVFLGMSQYLPPSSAHNIGFIYDLGFLKHPENYPHSHAKLGRITKDVAKRADTIITISAVSKADIAKTYKVPKSKIQVLYPGIRSVFSRFGAVHKQEQPYFLFVGALKPGKNLPTILKAFAGVRKAAKKQHKLVLVGGDFWRDDAIDRLIHGLGLEGAVREKGHVSDDELAQYYRGAAALVTPSLWEGFCLPAAEAMACGCPVIGSTTAAFPEIVGEAGILVEPTDVKAVAKAMKQVLMPSVRRALVDRGIQKAKGYRWEAFAKELLALINKKT